MHYDEPPKRELIVHVKQQYPKHKLRTILIASVLIAFVAVLTSVIYLVARDKPESFMPVIIPIESQPASPEESVKEAPQPKQ